MEGVMNINTRAEKCSGQRTNGSYTTATLQPLKSNK